MPTIYNKINKYHEEELNKTLETSKRADFCIGYFNLRGWRIIADNVEKLEGGFLLDIVVRLTNIGFSAQMALK